MNRPASAARHLRADEERRHRVFACITDTDMAPARSSARLSVHECRRRRAEERRERKNLWDRKITSQNLEFPKKASTIEVANQRQLFANRERALAADPGHSVQPRREI